MQLIISPAENGRHHVHLGDRLLTTSDNPLDAAARILKDEGVHWSEPLDVFHAHSRQCLTRCTVGDASRPPVLNDDGGLGLQTRRAGIFDRSR